MTQGDRLRGLLLAILAGICFVNAAYALDPARAMSQYIHDKWGVERGFLGGAVYAISQSADGYLWIGTERGLVRFDGLNFTLIQRPIPDSRSIGPVRELVSDAEGNLWILLDGPHLLLYREGRFEDAYVRFGMQDTAFTAMSLDNMGRLLLSGLGDPALRYRDGKFETIVHLDWIPGTVISMAETRDGRMWMGTRDDGLLRIDREQLTNVSRELANSKVNALLPANNGGLWIGTDSGIKFWDRDRLANQSPLSPIDQLQILAMIQDRLGNVWVGSNHGLFRIADGAISPDRDSDGQIRAIYEDRDGDIWFGGPRGIERLRDGMFTTYSTAQGLPSESIGPVYVDVEGQTWFAPLSGGLYWLKDGRVGRITIAGLDSDVVYSISGGDGEVWIGRQRGGLTMLTRNGDSFLAKTYTEADGLAQNSVYSVHRNRDGTVWAGTVSAGVSKLTGGKFTNYSVVNGLTSNSINSIVEGHDGAMWFATPSGLSSFAGGRWMNRSASNGVRLPSSDVRSIFEDSRQVLWIATSGGLAFLQSGHIGVPGKLPESLHEEIFGIAEDKAGFLWFATSDHVLQVDRDRLLTGALGKFDIQSYGIADGLQGVEGVRRDRSVVADNIGQIWISLNRGLSVTGPRILSRDSVPVGARIESMSAGGEQVNIKGRLKFAGNQNINFNYASTSLSMPELSRFRYKLDGYDPGWSDIVASRQVIYSHLGPGTYRFRVVASSREGLWNGPETTVPFVVEPAFWQTLSFRVLCFALGSILIVALYRLRTYQLTRQLDARFQERLAERTRIAQELHDTLLQGFVSASMQLDVAEDQLPDGSPAKPALKRILQLMARVTEEGRNALRGLRSTDEDSRDLELAFSRVRQELAIDEKIGYRVIANNTTRPLRPVIRDEVYRIGREALANAFLHSRANTVEVEVEYASRYLRVMVRDDGCGIDPQVLDTGRRGHWGLPGMRERSEGIGARLRLLSRVGAGTEVELTVPSAIAFESQPRRPVSQWLTWFNREKFEPESGGKRKRGHK